MAIQPVRCQRQALFDLLPQGQIRSRNAPQIIGHAIDRNGCQRRAPIGLRYRWRGQAAPQGMATQAETNGSLGVQFTQ
ncbi:hypothetical protein D3C71_1952870 [compost metagenome]